MKFNIFTSFVAINMILFSVSAQADIVAHAKATPNENFCQEIAGQWAGAGTIIVQKGKYWGEYVCVYNGHGNIQRMSDGTQVSLNMTLMKQSGSSYCPEQKIMTIKGSCDQQTLIFKTPDADLTGNIYQAGKAADINGHVYFTVHIPVVGDQRGTAEIKNLNLKKQ